MTVLSVICARAGSKGLRNKCVEKIKDKMVIEYVIDYSLSLGNNVKTVISTDIISTPLYFQIAVLLFISLYAFIMIPGRFSDIAERETNNK